ESFTNLAVSYDVKIDFSRSPIGHIIECSCKYFRDHRSCCKHIALVQVELPPITFFRASFWEHEANFHPRMLEPYVHDDPATAVVPEVDLLSIYFQRFGLLD